MTQARYIAPFRPLTWQVAPWRSKAPVLLLDGGAGGGKSRLWMEKLHAFALKYPETTNLMLRKTRASMTNSAVLAFERRVVGGDPRVVHKESKFRFEYANGSIVAYGGMASARERESIRSIGADGGLGMAVMEEANAFVESDFNELGSRMRDPRAPWRQLIIATNPDSDLHWINRRLILGGEAERYLSFAGDNPYNPADYAARLAALTGVQALRLAEGKWSRAEGLVYDVWQDGATSSDAGNVRELELDPARPVCWFVDDGYSGELDPATKTYTATSHPRVILIAQITPTGAIHVLDESYAVRTLSDAHIKDVLAMGYPKPQWAAVDGSAAELRGRLHELGIATINGTTRVEEGIKELRRRIAPDENSVRQVLVAPRCTMLRAEMAAYVMNDKGEPVKAFDHGPDALRYGGWVTRWGDV